MKHVIKDIPCDGEIIEIHDKDLDKEWSDWYRRKEENPTDEIYNEGKLLYDKIREKYGITTCIRVGHLKENGQFAMTVSDIPAEETYYHPSDGTYVKKINLLNTNNLKEGEEELKEELLKIFNELLDKWESAEYTWVNEHGISSDYDNIEKEKQDFIERLNKILESC